MLDVKVCIILTYKYFPLCDLWLNLAFLKKIDKMRPLHCFVLNLSNSLISFCVL